MRSSFTGIHSFEFYFPELDTLVQVEEADGDVTIRATRDTFSERRKCYFIRELAAEGFIPDSYQWFSLAHSESVRGVRWLIDISWVKLHPAVLARARHSMTILLSGSILLCVGLMIFAFMH